MIAPAGEPAPGFPRRLDVTAAAGRQLRKLPARDAVADALATYAATGRGDVTRLVGVRAPQYRLRVGEYRAVLALSGAGTDAAVVVLWVGNRRDAY